MALELGAGGCQECGDACAVLAEPGLADNSHWLAPDNKGLRTGNKRLQTATLEAPQKSSASDSVTQSDFRIAS